MMLKKVSGSRSCVSAQPTAPSEKGMHLSGRAYACGWWCVSRSTSWRVVGAVARRVASARSKTVNAPIGTGYGPSPPSPVRTAFCHVSSSDGKCSSYVP
eukprot:2157247-Prymnesium_polylepis.2